MQKNLIRLSPPFYDKREETAIIEVLRSGRIAQGRAVAKFEKEFAGFIGVNFAVAVNNGTSALIAGLTALGIGPGDEVITPVLTFGATANSVLAVGAKVKFADINPDTYSLEVLRTEEKITKKTRAIIGVDLYGQCADWSYLRKLARRYRLWLIEDAAQAHGAVIGRKRAGSFGDLATFSFYASKNMTTGEGGMVTTNNRKVYKKLQLLRNHGMKIRYRYEMLGFNLRMTEMAAALGRVQLTKLPHINRLRQRNAQYLNARLKNIRGITLPFTKNGQTHVFHEYVIRLSSLYKLKRDKLRNQLKKVGIETGIHYPYPLHIFPLYGNTQNKFPVAEKATAEILSLPVHPGLKKVDLDYIVSKIKEHAS